MGETTEKDFQFHDLSNAELEFLTKLFDGYAGRSIRAGSPGYCVISTYKDVASDIYSIESKPGDIVVTSYQRSGTTWTQELAWLIANDLDYEGAAAVPLNLRYNFLELSMFFDGSGVRENIDEVEARINDERAVKSLQHVMTPASETLQALPSPRFIKTHLPLSLLSPKLLQSAKVIYIARDPRDVIVSCYFHAKLFKMLKFRGTLKQVWQAFRDNLFIWTPYFEHVKEAWARRHEPNVLFLFYEDMLTDLPGSVKKVAEFLGKELTPEQMERLCNHLRFENFKDNQSVNYNNMRKIGFLDPEEKFIRKGKSGGWREHFDEEMTQEAQRWIEHNLRDTDLRYPSMDNSTHTS